MYFMFFSISAVGINVLQMQSGLAEIQLILAVIKKIKYVCLIKGWHKIENKMTFTRNN